ncbi:helix-turn-helix transcriptional regulator [Nonomuraea sp. K274]|uniref:Helix-turn-helix transcriptional regulator n=1 Tax=Nonomuraea cypriaca TaxID=1187855 RepID=A0A931ANU7_9ACTN|nr:helix-turn-helix transcriptional regulator [Nonomuraea cypriaca]MBF8192302.1 helix-turn-helix transcriptional regulator [Nonomuraea cypriaca]
MRPYAGRRLTVGASPKGPYSQVYRLVAERPERLNLRMLMALPDILDCTTEDLIEPVQSTDGPDG